MILAKRRHYRPNNQISWHFEIFDVNLLEQNTKKIQNVEGFVYQFQEVIDENTIDFCSVWENIESFEKYKINEDFKEYIEAREQYNISVGITKDEIEIKDLGQNDL